MARLLYYGVIVVARLLRLQASRFRFRSSVELSAEEYDARGFTGSLHLFDHLLT